MSRLSEHFMHLIIVAAFSAVRVAKVKPEDVQPVPLPSDVYTEGPSPYKSKGEDIVTLRASTGADISTS